MTELLAEIEDEETRLDSFLAGRLPELSRSRVQTLIEQGCVTLEGKPLRKNYRVGAGDLFSVEVPDAKPLDIRPENIPLDIVYEDSDLIVLNKPKGLVVHPAPGHESGTLVNALLYHCGDTLSGIGGVTRPGIVHRLDMDTSGLMLCAKNDKAHQHLSAQLSDRSLSRVYEAILRGTPKEQKGIVDAPIGRHPTDRKKMAVTQSHSRKAVTHYRVLEPLSGYSYVQCKLETGRTHQIRVHMAYLGHPVAGDMVYGGGKNELGLLSQCLHARYIQFIHPSTGEKMQFGSELPAEFTQALWRLGHDSSVIYPAAECGW